jgi:hypothetical protein
VLVALRNLIETGQIARDRIILNFYGRYDTALQQAIIAQNLEGVATQLGRLPRSEIRQHQRSSHLLLLLQWENPDERGILPLKFYEYLDAGRPILATGGADPNEIGAILEETRTGVTAISTTEIERAIVNVYEKYLNPGTLDYHGLPEVIANYSYSGCARKLLACLEHID